MVEIFYKLLKSQIKVFSVPLTRLVQLVNKHINVDIRLHTQSVRFRVGTDQVVVTGFTRDGNLNNTMHDGNFVLVSVDQQLSRRDFSQRREHPNACPDGTFQVPQHDRLAASHVTRCRKLAELGKVVDNQFETLRIQRIKLHGAHGSEIAPQMHDGQH